MTRLRAAGLALLVLTVLRLALAARLPLSPDEAYYWIFSRHLQTGYLDAPPMVAVFIRAGTMLAGDTPLGVRLLAPFAVALASVLVWRAGDDLFPARKPGLAAACLLNATLLLAAGALIMTPDTPLLLFWCATLAALGRWRATGEARWWLAIGLAAGLAMEAKYTALLLPAGIGLWLVATPGVRGELRRPWPWAGLLVALAVELPNVAWNAAHGFVSFAKQGGREAAFAPGHALGYFGELVAGQAALVTPVVFAIAVAGVWRLGRDRDPAARLLLWLVLPGAAIFVAHTLAGRVQANWPAIVYPAALIAAGLAGRALRPALITGFAVVAVVLVQIAAAPLPLPPRADPIARQLGGWAALVRDASAGAPGFVTSDDYQTLSELAFHAGPGLAVYGFGQRWALLGLPPAPPPASSADGTMLTKHQGVCPPSAARVVRRADGAGRGAAAIQTYARCPLGPQAGGFILPRA